MDNKKETKVKKTFKERKEEYAEKHPKQAKVAKYAGKVVGGLAMVAAGVFIGGFLSKNESEPVIVYRDLADDESPKEE